MARKPFNKKLLTALFYGSIGLAGSLVLSLAFYWGLSLNSSIYNLINNIKSQPVYLWSYIILTLGAIIIFGVNISLLVYRFRKFGLPKLGSQAGGGLGSLIGVAASSCPVCGSLLLSAIGITGGLAAFPFQGLELKALSFGLLALPVWLTTRDLRKLSCDDASCPVPQGTSFQKNDRPLLVFVLLLVIVLAFVGWNMLKSDPIIYAFAPAERIVNPNDNKLNALNTSSTANELYDEVVAKVLPEKGFQSKIFLGDAVIKLIQNGVIDREKLAALYKDRGEAPNELGKILDQPSYRPILLTRNNANMYVNFLWPLGLSNYMSTNKGSPVNGKSLFNFASTGGWNLGREANGGAYFNKFVIVKLTPAQEALVTRIAQNTYRPCCDNSTFFQDCNHGSALLGLLGLGASQGLSENQVYKEALAFNSFWFPHNYIQTALYFKIKKNVPWENVDPKEVMGYNYSAVTSWSNNVASEIAKIPNLLPQTKGGAGCST